MKEYIVLATSIDDFGGYYPVNGRIVRCNDCGHCHLIEYDENGKLLEEPFYSCSGKLTTNWDYYNDCVKYNPVEPDGFCAWGERRNHD